MVCPDQPGDVLRQTRQREAVRAAAPKPALQGEASCAARAVPTHPFALPCSPRKQPASTPIGFPAATNLCWRFCVQICDANGNEFCNMTAALDGPTCPPWNPPPSNEPDGGSSKTGAIVGGVVGGVVGGALLAFAAVFLVRRRRRRQQRMSPFIAEVGSSGEGGTVCLGFADDPRLEKAHGCVLACCLPGLAASPSPAHVTRSRFRDL